MAQIAIKLGLTSLGDALEEAINNAHANLGLQIKEEEKALYSYDLILPEKDYKKRESRGANVFSDKSFIEMIKEALPEDDSPAPLSESEEELVQDFYKEIEEKIENSKDGTGSSDEKYYRGKS